MGQNPRMRVAVAVGGAGSLESPKGLYVLPQLHYQAVQSPSFPQDHLHGRPQDSSGRCGFHPQGFRFSRGLGPHQLLPFRPPNQTPQVGRQGFQTLLFLSPSCPSSFQGRLLQAQLQPLQVRLQHCLLCL